MVRFWLSPRVRRTDFVFGIIAISLAFIAGLFALTGGLQLMVSVGFRTQLALIGTEPFEVTGLRLVCDAMTAWFVVRRVRDTDHPGWWSLGILALPLLFGKFGALLGLLAIVALVILPGTIGPNRFGPDPRGWTSREHYEEEQRRLKSGQL